MPCNRLMIYKIMIQLYHMQLMKRIRYPKGKEVQDMFLRGKKKLKKKISDDFSKSCQK